VSSAGVLTSLTIDGSSIVNNYGTGIRSSGGNSYVRIGGSTISVNGIGVSTDTGGFLQSFKNNHIAATVPTVLLSAPSRDLTARRCNEVDREALLHD